MALRKASAYSKKKVLPYTRVSKRRQKSFIKTVPNQKIVKSNCLAVLDPQLAKLWHPTKTGKLTPYDVGVGSGKRVWWKCPEGDDHVWKARVGEQAKKRQGCPICI